MMECQIGRDVLWQLERTKGVCAANIWLDITLQYVLDLTLIWAWMPRHCH
jgi:hypothetical protein